MPAALPIEAAAPILCAGITTYSPLKHWGVTTGTKVGVVGLGGLGDMAVKIAIALGAEVTVFTTTQEKIAEAGKLGATGVLETDKQGMEAVANSLDFILSTVPEKHNVDPFVAALKRDGTFCAVGALTPMPGYNNMQMVMGRKSIAASANRTSLVSSASLGAIGATVSRTIWARAGSVEGRPTGIPADRTVAGSIPRLRMT